MPQVEILICEAFAIDRDTARTIPFENIPPLDHELLDHAMERCFQVPGRLRTSRELPGAHPPEILRGSRRLVRKKLHLYAATGNSTYSNIKEHYRISSGDGVQNNRVGHGDGHRRDGVPGRQLFTMRFRRCRLQRYAAAVACGDLYHVARRFAAMCGSGHSWCWRVDSRVCRRRAAASTEK